MPRNISPDGWISGYISLDGYLENPSADYPDASIPMAKSGCSRFGTFPVIQLQLGMLTAWDDDTLLSEALIEIKLVGVVQQNPDILGGMDKQVHP
jgi:hypothetical protein